MFISFYVHELINCYKISIFFWIFFSFRRFFFNLHYCTTILCIIIMFILFNCFIARWVFVNGVLSWIFLSNATGIDVRFGHRFIQFLTISNIDIATGTPMFNCHMWFDWCLCYGHVLSLQQKKKQKSINIFIQKSQFVSLLTFFTWLFMPSAPRLNCICGCRAPSGGMKFGIDSCWITNRSKRFTCGCSIIINGR